MPESIRTLDALRRHIASLHRGPAVREVDRVTTGHAPLDAVLDGGLMRGQLHELFADPDEDGAVAGVALALAHRASQGTGKGAPLLWLRSQAAARVAGSPYGPGLVALGLDPADVLIGVMPDDAMLLRAAVDALRCPALGALIVELRGRAPLLDLTASRRLALAAEESGVIACVLRIGAEPTPSAAATRWRVAAAPSDPLAGDTPGHSAFHLSLLRRRGGADGGEWRLIWNGERGAFGDAWHERDDAGSGHDDQGRGGQDDGAPLSGDLAALPADRSAADHATRSLGPG
jgi:protein ImuA